MAGGRDRLGNLVLHATSIWYDLLELLAEIWHPGLTYSVKLYHLYESAASVLVPDGQQVFVHECNLPKVFYSLSTTPHPRVRHV